MQCIVEIYNDGQIISKARCVHYWVVNGKSDLESLLPALNHIVHTNVKNCRWYQAPLSYPTICYFWMRIIFIFFYFNYNFSVYGLWIALVKCCGIPFWPVTIHIIFLFTLSNGFLNSMSNICMGNCCSVLSRYVLFVVEMQSMGEISSLWNKVHLQSIVCVIYYSLFVWIGVYKVSMCRRVYFLGSF